MTVIITLQTAGADTGPTFDLYSNATGSFIVFQTGVAKATLLSPGYTCSIVPDNTTIIRIQSTGVCTSYADVYLVPASSTTTTTSTTSTTTSTSTSSTTTTTTTALPYVSRIVKLGASGWPAICSAATTTVYFATQLAIGEIMYTDNTLTTPVTGSTIMADSSGDNSTYNVDTLTGEILSSEGNTCA